MKFIAITFIMLLISGCAKLPECNNIDALTTVKSLILEKLNEKAKQFASENKNDVFLIPNPDDIKKFLNINSSTIVEQSFNKESKTRICQAKIELSLANEGQQHYDDFLKEDKKIFQKIALNVVRLIASKDRIEAGLPVLFTEADADNFLNSSIEFASANGISPSGIKWIDSHKNDIEEFQKLLISMEIESLIEKKVLLAYDIRLQMIKNAPGVISFPNVIDAVSAKVNQVNQKKLREIPNGTISFDLFYTVAMKKVDGEERPFYTTVVPFNIIDKAFNLVSFENLAITRNIYPKSNQAQQSSLSQPAQATGLEIKANSKMLENSHEGSKIAEVEKSATTASSDSLNQPLLSKDQNTGEKLSENQSKFVSPSFECNRASNYAEKAICSSNELATMDNELAATYKTIFQKSPDKNGLKLMLNEWRKNTRDKCKDIMCIKQAYTIIESQLTSE